MKKKLLKANFRLHKAALVLLLLTVCLPIFNLNCAAQGDDGSADIKENVDEILEKFNDALPEGHGDSMDAQEAAEALGIKRILGDIAREVEGQGTEISAFLLLLLGIGLISSLSSLYKNEIGVMSSRAVGVVVSALLFDRLLFLVRGAIDSLGQTDSFFSAVIPISLAVNSLGASPNTATTQAVGMGLTLGIYSFISKKLVLPIVSAIFVSSAASSIDPLFGRIAKGVRDTFFWVMGIFTALVGATFSLQSVISASADTAVMRSARYAISGTIPIVGGAVSGALGVIAGGTSYARGVVGGGAIAVVITLVLSPLVTLLLYRLCLKIGMFFFSVSSLDGCCGVLSSFLYAIDALIAAYTMTSVVYIVELVAFLKGGVSFA